jgi:hypothetical protein
MDRCPNCRARIEDTASCRRCGLELGLLKAAEQAAEARLDQAVARLARGDHGGAEQALLQSLEMKQLPLAARLLGLVRHRRAWAARPTATTLRGLLGSADAAGEEAQDWLG